MHTVMKTVMNPVTNFVINPVTNPVESWIGNRIYWPLLVLFYWYIAWFQTHSTAPVPVKSLIKLRKSHTKTKLVNVLILLVSVPTIYKIPGMEIVTRDGFTHFMPHFVIWSVIILVLWPLIKLHPINQNPSYPIFSLVNIQIQCLSLAEKARFFKPS